MKFIAEETFLKRPLDAVPWPEPSVRAGQEIVISIYHKLNL